METQLVLDVGVDRTLPTTLLPGVELGEIFTRRWVVELILDLAGYTADRDLSTLVAVEPSCGEGAFFGPMVERLLASAATHRQPPGALYPALRAFDLSTANVERAQKLAVSCLVDAGVAIAEAQALAEIWVTCDDFLLAGPAEQSADFVIGNPPYIRLENVARERSDAYRRTCSTMRGRSDVYVGFIEKGPSTSYRRRGARLHRGRPVDAQPVRRRSPPSHRAELRGRHRDPDARCRRL